MPEDRFGVRMTEHAGVFFTEAIVSDAEPLESIEVTISRQNSSLIAVKSALATKVHDLGGDLLMQFDYGQRKHRWYERLYKWDTELWFGKGVAARAPRA